MRNVGVSYSEECALTVCENTKRNELLWHTIPQRCLESTLLILLTVERLQLNGKKLSAVTVGVRNNSQPATVVEMAYTRDLKSLGEIFARSNRVGSTTNR